MTSTYQGSCQCGAVAFACELDLAQGTSRCNCSVCWKSRFWKAIVPGASLRILRGQESLSEYRFGSRTIAHRFCRHCGIKLFGQVESKEPGGAFCALNVACLEGDVAAQLAAAPLSFEDGRHDRWDQAPAECALL